MHDDAFGAGLEACWAEGGEPGRVHVVMERDDGFVEAHDVAVYFQQELDGFDQWCLDRARGRVLDVGCGAGRHALPLHRQGIEVVGLDPSPGAIRVCHARGLRAVEGRVPELPDGLGAVDTFLMMGNNLGLLQGRDRAHEVLRALAGVAAPGAQVLGTGFDPAGGSASEHLAYRRRNIDEGRLPGELRLRTRYRRRTDKWFPYLLVSLPDLVHLLAGSSWQVGEHLEQEGRYAVQLLLA